MPVKPSWRIPFGMVLILLLIAAWCVLVVTAADLITGWPWPLEALFFIVAGIAWILPLKPLIRWMQTGKWRE